MRNGVARMGTAAMLAATMAWTGGCHREGTGEEAAGAGVSRTATRGPVTVTLSARPATPGLDEHAWVTLDVTAEKNVTVLEDRYGEALRDGDRRFEYRVVSSRKEPPQPTEGGGLRWTHRFELEFFLPGDFELPPAEVSFTEVERSGDEAGPSTTASEPGEPQTVSTEPLTLAVKAGDATVMSPEEMKRVARLDPIDLPRRWHQSPAFLAVIVGIIVVSAAAWYVWRSRRRRADSVVRVPAHEWFRGQIAALVADDLVTKGLVQEFHYRISAIVRGYIERRFDVSAPEMTTEEFLVAAAEDARFGGEVTGKLDGFLTACDRVKYACHRPGPTESHSVLQAAGDFVERTRDDLSPSGVGDASMAPIEERAA